MHPRVENIDNFLEVANQIVVKQIRTVADIV